MPEHTSGATEPQTTEPPAEEQSDQPSWAGAMAQIDAEIKELQEMLAQRRRETPTFDDDPGSDSVA